jgi:hypothetical protein
MIFIEETVKNEVYNIYLKSSGIKLGEFVKVDGFYYFAENKSRTWGLWSEEFLKSLVSELELLNKPLNDYIAADYINFQ